MFLYASDANPERKVERSSQSLRADAGASALASLLGHLVVRICREGKLMFTRTPCAGGDDFADDDDAGIDTKRDMQGVINDCGGEDTHSNAEDRDDAPQR